MRIDRPWFSNPRAGFKTLVRSVLGHCLGRRFYTSVTSMGGPDILNNQRADASSTGKVINIIAIFFSDNARGSLIRARGINLREGIYLRAGI